MDIIKARRLRKNMTQAERTLWRYLRLRQFSGYKFRRQQPIGKYIVGACTLDAVKGTLSAFDLDIHRVRPFPG